MIKKLSIIMMLYVFFHSINVSLVYASELKIGLATPISDYFPEVKELLSYYKDQADISVQDVHELDILQFLNSDEIDIGITLHDTPFKNRSSFVIKEGARFETFYLFLWHNLEAFRYSQ